MLCAFLLENISKENFEIFFDIICKHAIDRISNK